MKYSHLLLKNNVGIKDYVNTQRVVLRRDEDESEEPLLDYTYQKDVLRSNLASFTTEREERISKRTIEVPFHLEYILINFFNDFDDKSESKYKNEYGLEAVHYSNFNQTVLFYISNETKFRNTFTTQLIAFYTSPANEVPEGHNYHTLTFISSFSFLSTARIKSFCSGTVTMTLIEKRYISSYRSRIYNALTDYVNGRGGNIFFIADSTVEIKNMDTYLDEITDNFDIIQRIQSVPPTRIYPNKGNLPRRGWDFITSKPSNLPTIGIIDTGIMENCEPLKDLIIDKVSLSNCQNMGVRYSHGTEVASLAVFGKSLSTRSATKEANASIYSIQALYHQEGSFSLEELKDAILDAHEQHGIQIFNLSISGNAGKEYNTTISPYAIMLDKLAYEHDLLIFIATGNLNFDDTNYYFDKKKNNDVSAELKDFLTYPNHYYGPDNDYLYTCKDSNIGEPAESMNNITIGAIADNLSEDNNTDLTLNKTLPAYYSKKYYIDYAQKINNTDFNKNQRNKNIFKPDVVMPGGDWLDNNSKMLTLGPGYSFNDFYLQSAGTSLATPLAANLAAKIAKKYPNIKMQTVKALIINSAEYAKASASIFQPIIAKYKNKLSQEIYNRNFDELDRNEKIKISSSYSQDRLFKNLAGHGLPNEEKCLYSSDKRATFLIEDSIQKGHYKVMHLKLPEYLRQSSKSKVLKVTGTLCFSFSPTENNQLGYNPIHISFTYLNANSDSTETAQILSNKPTSFNPSIKLYSTEQVHEMLSIHGESYKWSEDFYPVKRKINSNTQKLEQNINVEDLSRVDDEIALAVRCVGRSSWDDSIDNPFSLIITLEQTDNNEINHKNLYEELSAINTVENAAIIEQEASLEVDA